MKFAVSRASRGGSPFFQQPCDEAVHEDGIPVGDYSHLGAKVGVWTVLIDSLESLLAFRQQYERIIIQESNVTQNGMRLPEIIIYDGWME